MDTPTLYCRDSALSVAGDIIAILTFVGGFLISINVYINSMRNAGRSLFGIANAIGSRSHGFDDLERKLQQSNTLDSDLARSLRQKVELAGEIILHAAEQLDQMNGDPDSRNRRVWGHSNFVLKQDLSLKDLERMDKVIETLRGGVHDVVLG
jgi:hypothetical protein